jgi:DNA-binding transcriptional regulator YiaG
VFHTIHRYEETGLGLPYPIVLIDAAEEERDEASEECIGLSVPDTEGLVAAVAIARSLHPRWMDGSEVRFIRRVIGMTARDFSVAFDLDPASFSRWENGKHQVGAWADRHLRMTAIIMLRDRIPALSIDPKAVLSLAIDGRSESDWPKISLRRVPSAATYMWDSEFVTLAV